MPNSANGSRPGKIGDLLHKELAKLIQEHLSTNTFGMITVSGVNVTDDLSYARIYVTVLPDEKEQQCMDALAEHANVFRSEMAKKLKLRIMPKIKFFYDDSLRAGSRMEELLGKVKEPKNNEES